MPESAVARLVKPGTLPERRWKNGTDHEILDGAVGEIGPEALAIAGRTLSVSCLAVLRLADGSEKAIPRVCNIIERTPGNHFEFLTCGEWRELCSILQRQKVW